MDSRVKKYNSYFTEYQSAAGEMRKYRDNCEEFYFNDVESSLSQFTQKQKNEIDRAYKIPVSTKISYPIIEQMIAFLTGNKPFPRLIAPTDAQANWTETYSKGYAGVWYESKADRELKLALRDMLVVGSGFLRARTNSFFNETTFNVVLEYVDWHSVYVDPKSKKEDFSDAERICIQKSMPKGKAEKEYNIKISDNNLFDDPSGFTAPSDNDDYVAITDGSSTSNDKKIVWIREWFEKVETNIYIGDDRYVSLKKPKQILIPNEDKLKLKELIDKTVQGQQEDSRLQNEIGQAKQSGVPESFTEEGLDDQDEYNNIAENVQGQFQGQQTVSPEQLTQMQTAYAKMPNKVPAFKLIDELGNEHLVRSITKIKDKKIKRLLIVGNQIIEEEVLNFDRYPLIHFTISHLRSPNKTYGVIHYIMDLVKAMNKFWSMMIYEMQVNNSRKVLYPQGAIIDKTKVESDWAKPNSWIEYVSNPSLPDGGMPTILEPSPLNQASQAIVSSLLQLVEYITGIYGVIQGNQNEAPNTFGATQSLQTFGTQRVKLYSRGLEPPLEDLAYAVISYLHLYAPRDKYLTYFNSDNQQDQVMFLDDGVDLQFKCRVELSNSLPTIRTMTAQLIGMVSAQTKNPYVADFLTKYMLKILDLPEGKELSEQIDVIKQMEQQISQLQQQLQASDQRGKALENNLYQKELAHKVDLEAEKQKSAIRETSAIAQNDIANQTKDPTDGSVGIPLDNSSIENITPEPEEVING